MNSNYSKAFAQLRERYNALQASEDEKRQDYPEKLLHLRERYKHAAGRKPRPLTILEIFGRSTDENFISDYLAYILDPHHNGIGTAPLEALFQLLGIDKLDIPVEKVDIQREAWLGTRRIDLLLEWEGSFVIGIENKIFAIEGDHQTEDYAKEIPRLYPDIQQRLVYLTRTGISPRSNKFQPLAYKDLLIALRAVSLSQKIDQRCYTLWQDFLEHLEEYIIMAHPERFEFSEKSKLYLENIDMITDLVDTYEREWKDAVEFIETYLIAHLEPHWETYFNTGKAEWHKIYKEFWETADIAVHFEYWFHRDFSTRKDLSFMVDVEGKKGPAFLNRFQKRYPALAEEYKARGISYTPKHRSYAIAWKSFKIPKDINQIAEVFLKAFEEFRFLEKEIDSVFGEMAGK